MKRRALLSAATTLPLLPRPGLAQAEGPWPSRPLRMVIPWPPGQSTDVQGRLIAQLLTERLGQPVVPENRPGAGGQIGTNAVAKAAPDGYTLLAASIGPISFQPLVSRTPYDVERELAPVVSYGIAPFMLLVRSDFPATDLRAFLALLRANPGKYSHNSSGVGGAQHLVTALFNAKAGIEALHVPFQGSGPALAALLGGHVSYGIDTPAAAMRLVQEGQLRSLGITTGRPSALLPGMPPIAAAGGPPDYDIGGWNGLMAPAGTPKPILDRLGAEVRQGLATPALRRHFEAIGVEVEARGPEEFRALLRELWGTFGDLIRQLGLRLE
ncbi:tripartite tricarboxylate transporter substrate binding protein [Siccirubricoccus sp. G192]|uniref:Bug family tripartite tricarboxylate transporter substrate binding protein n=1 Tax=Siccirubricoccus sp. G192 TaxID=2849651 RepID=UPI001C2BCA3F|nr:tripartite tricarboxylate transporter substrate binding protein [Siccirubricoccus sp. G192]MBV1795749.1 tripartite tricarboxylate transporter substrate binding protein [Siccirubricoccus sp. G192]